MLVAVQAHDGAPLETLVEADGALIVPQLGRQDGERELCGARPAIAPLEAVRRVVEPRFPS
jgi:hypothetical protein